MDEKTNLVNDETTIDKAAIYKDAKVWRKIVVKHQKPDLAKAIWQLINTLVPFIAIWVAMSFVYDYSIWLTIPLILIAGGLGVRIFIIFHDCGHQSFFKSRKSNDFLGYLLGVLAFTPYRFWHWEHKIHHSTTGDLDRRSVGDVWTMTVKEYEESSWLKRMLYRFVRNPWVLFTFSPIFLFFIWQRFSAKQASMKDRLSVLWTNIGIAAMIAAGCSIFGWQKYLILQFAVSSVTNSAGVWLFYVQHQFEDVYWARNEEWNFAAAALEGSSFYKLPKVLQWFSGNIGYHHIHHLSSRIPNYRLEECHNSEPIFQEVPPMTLRSSMACLKYRLHDEENGRLVGFSYLKQHRMAQAKG